MNPKAASGSGSSSRSRSNSKSVCRSVAGRLIESRVQALLTLAFPVTIIDLLGGFNQFEKCSRNVHLDKFVEDATREAFAKSVSESSIGPLNVLLVGPEMSNVGCNLLIVCHSKIVRASGLVSRVNGSNQSAAIPLR